jgi:hypothetical protein
MPSPLWWGGGGGGINGRVSKGDFLFWFVLWEKGNQ